MIRMGRMRVVIVALLVGAAGIVGFTRLKSGAFQPTGEPSTSGADIRIVSKGEPLNLRDHLVAGKYTLFDYYADWCPPCRQLSPRLEELARRNPNLALRKIDIVDWSHPVAQQQGVSDLPYLRLYDPQGKLVAQGDPALESLKTLFGLTDPPEAM